MNNYTFLNVKTLKQITVEATTQPIAELLAYGLLGGKSSQITCVRKEINLIPENLIKV